MCSRESQHIGNIGTVRKAAGGLSVLITALVLALLVRAVGLWTTTGDLFYITSAGFYAIVTAILLVGVAWGFRNGESAEGLYAGIVGVLSVGSMLGAAYYFFTGFVLGSGPTAGTAGISLFLSGIVLLVIQIGIRYTSQRLRK